MSHSKQQPFKYVYRNRQNNSIKRLEDLLSKMNIKCLFTDKDWAICQHPIHGYQTLHYDNKNDWHYATHIMEKSLDNHCCGCNPHALVPKRLPQYTLVPQKITTLYRLLTL